MDADTLEVLTQGGIHSAATIPNRDEITGVLDGPESTDAGDVGIFEGPTAITETSPVVVINHFLLGNAGAPIPGVPQGQPAHEPNQATAAEPAWAPFNSECDWEFARWAKTRGPTSSAVTDLLAIDQVHALFKLIILSLTHSHWKVINKLGLSYHTVKQLNDIIDNKLPGRPPFRCRELIIGDERLEFYHRDIIDCIRSLYGDPQFVQDLMFAPRHYTSPERVCRIYNEMHTGDWWWAVQVRTVTNAR